MPFDFYSGNSLKVLGCIIIYFWPEKKIRPSKSFIALLNKQIIVNAKHQVKLQLAKFEIFKTEKISN